MSEENTYNEEIIEETVDTENDSAVPVIETSFGMVTGRLSEIAETVEDSTLPIDEALDLLEEAVALGMQASSLLESDMTEHDEVVGEEDQDVRDVVEGDTSAIVDESDNSQAYNAEHVQERAAE